jgi:large subunit ribosomal protein L10
MTKAEKTALIEELAVKFEETKFFYVTDFSTLTVAQTNDFRRKCFENNIEMRVLKNTLVRKALERVSETAYEGLYEDLKGPSAILFSESGKVPAQVIKEYRGKDGEKPELKVAYIDQDIIRGDDQLEFLTKLKSKEDLLGELITLLQSPAKNLVSALQGSEQKLIGLVKYGPNTMMALLKGIEEKN